MSKFSGPSFVRFCMLWACMCLLLPAPALAQLPWLSGPQIETALAGRTLDGMYASGRRFTEHYRKAARSNTSKTASC